MRPGPDSPAFGAIRALHRRHRPSISFNVTLKSKVRYRGFHRPRLPSDAMQRARLAVVTAAACLLAAATALALAARGGHSAVDAQTGFAGAPRPPGMPPPHFALRDQNGRTVDAASLRGRPAIVSFLYTSCRDTCPLV